MLSFLIAALLLAPALSTDDGYPRDPNIDVQHYAFTLSLSDDSDRIIGTTRVTIAFQADSVESFQLDLVDGMTVSAVTDGDTNVDFVHGEDKLLIGLREPAMAGEERTFSVTYGGTPTDGLVISTNKFGDRTFFGDNWPNRARHWLPTVDHPHDKATVEWIVRAPSKYQVVATGELIEESDMRDGRRLTHWITSVPIPTKVMVMGAAEFAVQHTEEYQGVDVQTWVYPGDRDAGFYDFAVGGRMLRFFVENIGPYPYEKLAHVQSKTRFGGMENASNIFYNERSVIGNRSNEMLVAHEIAHQWFGNSVTEADWFHVWLSEGFASYFTQLYMEHAYGKERLHAGMRAQRRNVLGYYDRAPNSPVVDTTITERLALLTTNTYQKGSWVLHMLRKELGDDTFWAGIQEYYARFRDSNALTQDFRGVMEDVSGRDLKGFFDQWLRRPGQPQLQIVWTWDEDAKEVALTVEQTQDGAAFDVPLDLAFHTFEGETRHTVRLDEVVTTLRVATPSKPELVDVDPDVWLLAQVAVRSR